MLHGGDWSLGANTFVPVFRELPSTTTRDTVELPTIEVLAVERADLTRVVQERVAIAYPGREPELVRDVGDAVAVVVDVDLVQHVIAELEEVGAASRILERDVVRDERDRVGFVRADEGVGVGVVGYRVLRDLWSFAM